MGVVSDCAATVDLNANGISDVWEVAFSAKDLAPESDSDSDGASNFAESIAGTDPHDPHSVLLIQSSAFLKNAHLIRWNSVAGKRYRGEGSDSVNPEVWQSLGEPVIGNGGEVMAAVPRTNPPFAAFRLQPVDHNQAITASRSFLEQFDSDVDGRSDIDEFAAGTNPFDASSRLEVINVTTGNAVVLHWPSVPGKHYQVESSPAISAAQWTSVSGIFNGNGSSLSTTLDAEGEPRFWRIKVFDGDNDLDGINDWEEQFLGLDRGPLNYRTNYPTELSAVTNILMATNIVSVTPGVPVANLTRNLAGTFEITREGNVNELTLNYTVGGDAVQGAHYVPLPGSVTLPPGAKSVEIPVIPISGVNLTPSKSVTLSLGNSEQYIVGTNNQAEVRVLKEVALSVRAFGAVGDGIVNDTYAIQNAILSLEASQSHNTLYFPPGTYRLNSPIFDSSTAISQYRLLRLGTSDLAGRDLIFKGDEGAVLYSTVDNVRAQMLLARASFRSLSFFNLTWKKDDNPLPPSPGGSPAGASGVTIALHDLRRVEAVDFTDCVFDNCHSAIVTTFKNGYDSRGRLAHFNFRRSRVINPFGSNTREAQTAFGGGQQISISPWVGKAIYSDSYFDGSSDDPPDPVKNPAGIRKDGSHYGSPLELIFTNNVVRRMGVEAVFQADEPYLGYSSTSFVIPPPDGVTTAQVAVYTNFTTYRPGQIINFRVGLTPGVTPFNALLTLTAFDPASWTLTVVNDGITPAIEGTNVPAGVNLYLQEHNPTIAIIARNVITDEGLPYSGDVAIASNSRATIFDNLIQGYRHGVYLYENVRSPLSPPTRGTWIHSNVVVPSNSSVGSPVAQGIISFGPEEIISDNLIIAPSSLRFTGVAVLGNDAWIEDNTVTAISISHYPYDSFDRSVGIGAGNPSRNATSVGNRTRRLDVGNGPWSPHQVVPHRVISHFSYEDILAIDHRGLIE